jgi:hypothetical protein
MATETTHNISFIVRIVIDGPQTDERLCELRDTLHVALRTICEDNISALDLTGTATVVFGPAWFTLESMTAADLRLES